MVECGGAGKQATRQAWVVTRHGRGMILRAFSVSGVFWGTFAVWLPDLQRAAGATDGQLGLALGGLAVAALPVMLWTGRFADRRGGVEALQVTLIASALSLPLPVLVSSFGGLVVALLVLGVTTGALDVSLSAAAAEWEGAGPPSERPLMSLAHALFSFGVVAGSLGSGCLRELGLTPLIPLLLVAAATAAISTEVPVHRHVRTDGSGGASGRAVYRSPVLLLMGAMVAAGFVVEDGLQSWTPLFLERSIGASPALSASGVAVFAAAMGCGRLAGHLASHRCGEGRLLLLGGIAGAAGLSLLVIASSGAPALVGLSLAGAGTSVLAPVLLTAVSRRAEPGRQGEALALVNGLGYVGFITGPPLVGLVSAAAGLHAAFVVLALVSLLLGLTGPALLVQRSRPSAQRVRTGRPAPGSGSR